MPSINIPLAGKYFFKLEGFPIPEVKSFTIDAHDTSGVEPLLMGSGSFEEFGPGTGTVELAVPKADIIPWELFNGQPPMSVAVASLEPASGVGPAWDLETFQVTNPGGPSQGETGAVKRSLKIAFSNCRKR